MKNRKEISRGIKFALFSVSAGVIEFAAFALLDGFTPWPYWPKYLIALVLSVLWNFTLNRRFTFRSAGNVPVAMLKVALFYAVSRRSPLFWETFWRRAADGTIYLSRF